MSCVFAINHVWGMAMLSDIVVEKMRKKSGKTSDQVRKFIYLIPEKRKVMNENEGNKKAYLTDVK